MPGYVYGPVPASQYRAKRRKGTAHSKVTLTIIIIIDHYIVRDFGGRKSYKNALQRRWRWWWWWGRHYGTHFLFRLASPVTTHVTGKGQMGRWSPNQDGFELAWKTSPKSYSKLDHDRWLPLPRCEIRTRAQYVTFVAVVDDAYMIENIWAKLAWTKGQHAETTVVLITSIVHSRSIAGENNEYSFLCERRYDETGNSFSHILPLVQERDVLRNPKYSICVCCTFLSMHFKLRLGSGKPLSKVEVFHANCFHFVFANNLSCLVMTIVWCRCFCLTSVSDNVEASSRHATHFPQTANREVYHRNRHIKCNFVNLFNTNWIWNIIKNYTGKNDSSWLAFWL